MPRELRIAEAALKVSRRPSVAGAVPWCVLLPLVAALLAAPGCGMGGGAPPPGGQLAIENLAKWYSLYRAENAGEAPPDEDALVAFIEGTLKARGDTLDREQLMTSPRDGQKYVVQYGKLASTNPELNVAVYEREGYGGKKLIAFELGQSREVDDAELQSLLAGK